MTAASISLTKNAGAVRLTMSAKVANDLGSLQRGLRAIAERLGHRACATGCDFLHLGQEREFVMSEQVALNPQPLPPAIGDLASYASRRGVADATVVVTIPESVNDDIEQLTKAVAVAVGKLGCGACCSGFDILFRRQFDFIAIDEKLDARGFGQYR